MKVRARATFVKDTDKLSDGFKQTVSDALDLMIIAEKLTDVPGLKSLKGGKKAKNAYRMRVKDYRICFYFLDETIELTRILPRKDVYKFFP